MCQSPNSEGNDVINLPNLHQVTVMLQHAAGRLPGILVTLPGVHPAPPPPRDISGFTALPG